MCRRRTRGKAGQEGKGSRTSTTHIELDYVLESESNRISEISACREMSSGRYTRRKCSEVTGKQHYKKNRVRQEQSVLAIRASTEFDGMQWSIIMRLKELCLGTLALSLHLMKLSAA